MSALIRAATVLAAAVLFALPAGAQAALVPHFTLLPASGNTQLSLARDGVAMAPLPGGRALVVGGFNGSGFHNTAEIFDSATDTFTPTATPLLMAREGAAVAPLPGGRVLVAGGATSGSVVLQSAEVFDPATGAFTALPASGNTQLSMPRVAGAAAPLPDGRVLIVGGSTTGGAVLASAELFDPASNTFTALPASGNNELQTARVNFAAVPMPGGKVLIVGGAGASAVLAGAEIFDPARETFTALPASGATELQTARTASAAAALPDGRVLIAGGDTSASGSVTSADVLSSAEVFDPASGTFSALPASGTTQLQNPRSYTAATALGNGQILIAGGAGPDYLASAELATLPPSCSPGSASLASGARSVQVALHCSGFSFSYAIVNGPAHGSLGVIDQAHGALTYTPDAGFAGADSFSYEATNLAGPSASATVTVVVPAGPPSASLGNVSVRGASASLPITCRGASGSRCTGTATFTTRVTSRRSAPTGVAAPAARRKPKVTTVTVATTHFAVPAGRRTTVSVTLNATGKRLLDRFYAMPTRMRLTGTPSLARTVRFRYVVIDASVNFHFESNSSSGVTSVTGLTPTTLPHRARVELLCHGPGCPFSKHVLIARSPLIRLAGQFHGAELHPGAVVQLIITAPFSVGEVHIVTISRHGPRLAVRCLPPGSRRPVVCA